jgi:hypothetical protein
MLVLNSAYSGSSVDLAFWDGIFGMWVFMDLGMWRLVIRSHWCLWWGFWLRGMGEGSWVIGLSCVAKNVCTNNWWTGDVKGGTENGSAHWGCYGF